MIPLHDDIPSKRVPFITWSIIAANCYIFYLQLTAGGNSGFERFISHWAVIPVHLSLDLQKYWYTLITAAFLHGGWMHIIGNMVFLYIFGDNVEDRLGHFKFILFYLLIGVIANGSQAILDQHSTIPLIGASGAIAGVLGAYFFYYPHSKIMTLVWLGFFVKTIEIPAFIFLGFWFIMQTINSSASFSMHAAKVQTGGVAFLAHAAGFISGLIFCPFFGDKRSKYK